MANKTCFLGGTCNNSLWRDKLQSLLTKVDAFNPVVTDWNEEAQKNEESHRASDDFVLYVITPKMTGVYSIAEVVDDSNKRPAKTIFAYLEEDDGAIFEKHQLKALAATAKLIAANGAKTFTSLEQIAEYLNTQ